MSEKIVMGLDFGSDSVRTLAVGGHDGAAIFAAFAAGAYSDVAAAQRLMVSRIEHVYQPEANAAAHFERLYQRYQAWAAQSEPLCAPGKEEI